MRPASAACQSKLLSGGKKKKVIKSTIRRGKKKTSGDTHLLGNLEPGLLEAEDGAAVEGGGDLQHGVVVVETATDVGHSHPFLYDGYSSDHVVTAQDLRGDKVAYLDRGKREMIGFLLF